jgi:hypothetical protein
VVCVDRVTATARVATGSGGPWGEGVNAMSIQGEVRCGSRTRPPCPAFAIQFRGVDHLGRVRTAGKIIQPPKPVNRNLRNKSTISGLSPKRPPGPTRRCALCLSRSHVMSGRTGGAPAVERWEGSGGRGLEAMRHGSRKGGSVPPRRFGAGLLAGGWRGVGGNGTMAAVSLAWIGSDRVDPSRLSSNPGTSRDPGPSGSVHDPELHSTTPRAARLRRDAGTREERRR